MPTTPGLDGDGHLDFVDEEASVVKDHVADHVFLREPDPSAEQTVPATPHTPTKETVLEHLPSCRLVHFACHGVSDPSDPSRSRLLLHDHTKDPLTVASLSPVNLRHAQLAYLSACRTASIDQAELIDEAIHLTSAFQLAGFPHVIGTLWEIDDEIAVRVTREFYSGLRTDQNVLDTRRTAQSLHSAVRTIRDRLPRTPYLWAGYLHVGA